jgi:glycosyltransferase involved in cell wall biosynthesis
LTACENTGVLTDHERARVPADDRPGATDEAGRNHPARVLHVEVNEDGTVGGSHQALYDLVKRIDRDLYQPVVLFYQDNVFSNALRAAGVEVITFERERERELAVRRSGRPVSKLLDIIFGAIHRRSRLLRSRSIDLLHLNNSPATGFDDWLPAARLSGIPCITSVMSVAPAVSGRIKRALMRRFDAVIPVSRYIRDNWAAAVGIPAERLHVVHHGVDIEALDSVNNSAERTGFERYPSAPAARHASRSPFIAFAVSAMIGTWMPVPCSAFRIAAVASSPSISGIWTSMSTRSNVLAVTDATASRPLSTITIV